MRKIKKFDEVTVELFTALDKPYAEWPETSKALLREITRAALGLAPFNQEDHADGAQP